MGLHSDTEIFKTAYELVGVTFDLVRNARREVKPILIRLLLEPCVELTAVIQDANIAEGEAKVPHFYLLLKVLQKVEVMLRTSHEKRSVPLSGFGKAIELTTSIGKQANALKRKFSPVT